MPKTSYQVFTDANTKIVTGYSGIGASSGDNGSKRVVIEKIENMHGSAAGAGSGEFHMYLGARKREKDRIEEMEQQKKIEEEKNSFAQKVERNRLEAEMRTQKNREKRFKMKERARKRQKLGHQGEVRGEDAADEEGADDGDNDETMIPSTNKMSNKKEVI